MRFLLPNDNIFRGIFDYTTAGDWDYVVAVERFVLRDSVDFIFLSFEIMDSIVVRWNLMRATDEAYIAQTSDLDPENLPFNTFSYLMRFRLILLMLSILHPDIWTIF